MSIPYDAGEPLTTQQIRELDVLAIEHVGIPGLVLMENAARNVAEAIYHWLVNPGAQRVVVLCGPGNNGGDGFVVARHLHNAGVRVAVVLAAAREKLRGDALLNFGICERMELEIVDATDTGGLKRAEGVMERSDVVVDALLGSGVTGAPRDRIRELIERANASRATRIAIDIPSGLNADTGAVYEPCFQAAATITFVASKVGFSAAGAAAVLGRVLVADIGAPRNLIPGRRRRGNQK